MSEVSLTEKSSSDQRFRLLVNSVKDYALYMLDRSGVVTTWNPGAERFKGYASDEIIGRHFSCFFTEEDRATGLPERALEIAATEGKFEAEGWRVRKDGGRFWASIVVDPVVGPDGDVIGFVKITRDISEKKEAERALFESEQRFRLLVQGVKDAAIYMLDLDGRISNWNTGAAAIKGYREEEIIGRHFSLFYTPEDRAAGEPARALATALSEGKYETEAWRVRKDGSLFWANVLIDPIRDDEGRLIGFAKVTRDITERRQSLLELEEARAALFQSQKLQALGELTGGIAHDFNNLMTVIRGSADLLRRGNLSEEKRERYLEAIIETVDRAASLTSHLLAFGRRQALQPQVIDVNVRLDALGEVLSRTLDERIIVTLDLDPELWPTEVDPAELETALLNAAFNSRDAMPEGGTITLGTTNRPSAEGNRICISITDTGEGMAPEVLQRVFEPFFTTKPVGKGTGLGLSQIHGFAAQSGGSAEVESQPGSGTTLRLLLPRSDKPLTVHDPQVEADEPGERLRILLVEDNPHVLAFAEHLLVDMGHVVVPAQSGREALETLEADHEFDVLLTDVVMPAMSGVELASEFRSRLPNLPVILATGYSEEVHEMSESNYELLRKPYDRAAVEASLRSALRASRKPGDQERDAPGRD